MGQGDEVFDEYERNVRAEYDWVEEEQFRKARATILKSFLERPRIYYTDYFHEKYEQKAKTNLERSIAATELTSRLL